MAFSNGGQLAKRWVLTDAVAYSRLMPSLTARRIRERAAQKERVVPMDEGVKLSDWYKLDVPDVLKQLQCELEEGLSTAEADRRRRRYGANALQGRATHSPAAIFAEQLTGTLVVMLVVASAVSYYLGEYIDGTAILTIVVLNALLGFFQEFRAEKAMAALQRLAVPTVRVRRDGTIREMSASELVPGDLVYVEAGTAIPADGRIVQCANLKVEEAALTGESESVDKQTPALTVDKPPLGDQRNMLFMGTVVTYGRGEMVVTTIGMETELGHIATMLQTVQREPTPLQRRLAKLGRQLAVAALAIVAVVFVMGILRDESPKLMFMTALSMAVAAVPEGLPAVATVALALGARRMLQHRALIRKLPAVETLGSVTVICSDKTGTLTENRMHVAVVQTMSRRFDFNQHPRSEKTFSESNGGESVSEPRNDAAATLLLAAAALCNDATLDIETENDGEFHSTGDPTETALVVAAANCGLFKTMLDQALPRSAEVPFDSQRKRMTTVHDVPRDRTVLPEPLRGMLSKISELDGARHVGFTKGAVDSLLPLCTRIFHDGHCEPMDGEAIQGIVEANTDLAGSGMRVLAIAMRCGEGGQFPSQFDADTLEVELVLLGVVALIDPPRPEAADAVQRCKAAGIRPVMITGDHPLTAMYIAQQVGIATDDRSLTGKQLAELEEVDLEAAVDEVSVFARVAPEHKLRIVRALQNRGQIVSMTGDGVNDAPALKKANIGVAMGITGTDVAKEAAEMVLLDDNFATIVDAVEQGRTIYDNIRKFIKYTMTSNAGEIWVMLAAPLFGMPLPLLPLQILWINLVTDGLPGLALAIEPTERDTMKRRPYPPGESVFSRGMAGDILWIGLLMGMVSLGVGYWYWNADPEDESYWRTMVFTVLTLSQMGNALAIRSERDTLIRIGLLSNKPLLGAILLTFVLQLIVVYVPAVQKILKTTSLSPIDLCVAVGLSSVVFIAVELSKFLRWRLSNSV